MGVTGAVATAADVEQWVCVGCRSRNVMAADVCADCGRHFGAGLEQASLPRHGGWRTTVMVLREVALVNLLFVVWRIVGNVSLLHPAGAFARGRAIWHLERFLRLPSELGVQRVLVPHRWLIEAMNFYYDYAHAIALVIFLGWLLWWHREHYPHWRNVVVVFTGCSLLIELVSVAPPRLFPSLGFVDTATRDHQSVYGPIGRGVTDQLSSVPSIHVGWAVLIAVAVITVSRSRWRWTVLAHPVVTCLVVVATANHFWLDGAAAVLLLAAIVHARRVQLGDRGLLGRLRGAGRPGPAGGTALSLPTNGCGTVGTDGN